MALARAVSTEATTLWEGTRTRAPLAPAQLLNCDRLIAGVRSCEVARTCPDCSTAMKSEAAFGVQYDVCPQCAGVWFDADELRTLMANNPMAPEMIDDEEKPAVQQQQHGPSSLLCPVCQEPLQHYHYLYNSPIMLQICEKCGGLWVQHGELTQIEHWLQQATGPMSPEEDAKVTLATAQVQHDAFMMRQQHMRSFFRMLNMYQPGWRGFWPIF